MKVRRIVGAALLALALVFTEGEAGMAARHKGRAKKRPPAALRVRKAPSATKKKPAKKKTAKEISAADLLHPYAGQAKTTPNLTFDPTPRGRAFGTAAPDDDGLSFRLRLGQEHVVDPLTQKDQLPKADPRKAEQSLEKLDLKGAMDKLNGKAEVQVNILKF